MAEESDAASERPRVAHMGKVLWLFVGAAVVVVLAVLAMRGEGRLAEVLTVGFAVGAALFAMAWNADGAISADLKCDLSQWLLRIDPEAVGRTVQRWPTHFAALFDRVFGKKHLSWRCFFRSSIASLLAFVLCTLIYSQAVPGAWAAYLADDHWPKIGGLSGTPGNLVFLGAIAAFANLLPDYLSLLETRYVIRRMERSRSVAGQVGWLVVDFLATAAIFFLLVGGAMAVIGVFETGSWKEPADWLFGDFFAEMVPNMIEWSLLAHVDDPGRRVLAIPVWTTFFTTLWVWLYFVAQFLMRLATPVRRTLSFLQYALPVEDRPLRAVGQVMALLACAGYCVVMLPAATLGGNAHVGYLEPEMVIIQPGSVRMGRYYQDLAGGERWEPGRLVTIAERFAIGKYEVTFEEYDRFAQATRRALPNDEGWGRGNRPVISITWEEAKAYAAWLSAQTGKEYRLPTEAEWAYAARAGTDTLYWWGDAPGKNRANCDGCGSQWDGKLTAPIGSFAPNPWGLHDMAGNVSEWVQDCHEPTPPRFFKDGPVDGSAWLGRGGECNLIGLNVRVVCGGSWRSGPQGVRAADCGSDVAENDSETVGFRLAQDR